MTLPPKNISASRTTLAQMAMPEDTNPNGHIHGGTIMKLIDTCAAVAAMRHARCKVVTAAVNRIVFHQPVRVGELVVLKASLNHTGRASMEIGVRVETETPMTGEVRHAATAYLTMVAIDADGCAVPVPGLICETAEDERRHAAAAERYARNKRRSPEKT